MTTTRGHVQRSARAAVLAWAAIGSESGAQDAIRPAASPAELPAVIVTAQKTRQTLEQVPASVSSLDGDFIRDVGATSFNDLQGYTANATVSASGSSGQLTVRGFGTVDSNQGFDPSVGIVYDGVFYSRSNFLAAFFNDVDRFEVLRGPQGTLFGKNTTAGLINIVSQTPREKALLKWEVQADANGSRSFRPVLQTGIIDGLAVRYSGNYDDGDRGTVHNTALNRPDNTANQSTSRVRLRYDAHGPWTLDLGAFASFQDNAYNLFQLSRIQPNLLNLARSYDPATEAVVDGQNSSNVPSREKVRLSGVSATNELSLDGSFGLRQLRLTSVTGGAEAYVTARDLDADFTAIPFIRDTLAEPSPQRQFTQELRLTGSHPDLFGWGHGFSFVTGAFYENATLKTSDLFQIEDLSAAFAFITAASADQQGSGALFPGGGLGTIGGQLTGPLSRLLALLNPVTGPVIGSPQSASVRLNQRTQNVAVFGQFEHYFLPQWALIGGLRYGYEAKNADASSQTDSLIIPLISSQQDFSRHVARSESDLSPKAGLKWQPDKRLNIYGTFSRGFKSGGFNGLPLNGDNLEYEPETATNYELGIKSRTRILGGPARLSATAFTTSFVNLQVSTFQNNSIVIRNAGKARSTGFETDLYWLPPLSGTSIYLSAGLADARYTRYPNAPVASDAPQCQSTAPLQTSPNCFQDLGGRPLPFASRWTTAFIPAYSLDLPLGVNSTSAIELLYSSSRYTNVDEDPRKLQPEVLMVNARLVLADSTLNAWSLTLRAQNLTNQVVVDETVDQPEAPGNLATVRTDHGRTWSANFQISFN